MNVVSEKGFASRLLLASAGLLVWGAHFLFVYVFAALACARSFAGLRLIGFGIIPFAILAGSVAALLMLAWLSIRAWRTENEASSADPDTPRFLRYIGAALAIYSAAAIFLQTLPVLILPVCM